MSRNQATLLGRCTVLSALLFAPAAALAQVVPSAAVVDRVVCPGDPPGNLASFDCNFTKGRRFEEFAADGLTDKALSGAVMFGTIAHLRGGSPTEWTGAAGWGKRIGSDYAQNLAKSVTAYGVGALVKDDRRHVQCVSEPGAGPESCGVPQRIGHALLDWATVRRSTRTGDGPRMPNVAMFSASAVSATVGNLWYPSSARTTRAVTLRLGGSLGSALLASAYNEFSPELGRLFAALIGRLSGTQHQGAAGGHQ